jgi:hypothetical protein
VVWLTYQPTAAPGEVGYDDVKGLSFPTLRKAEHDRLGPGPLAGPRKSQITVNPSFAGSGVDGKDERVVGSHELVDSAGGYFG